jgi:23S rRNA pseudouridine1911/1915/1917 synthase
MSHLGHPVVGDALYGGGARRAGGGAAAAAVATLGRQALHARSLGFIHPARRQSLRFESDIPNQINKLINSLDGV